MERAHKKLQVYQQSLLFAKQIYAITAHFPDDERFGIVQQMRRASVSILSNLSEGAARKGNKEAIHRYVDEWPNPLQK